MLAKGFACALLAVCLSARADVNCPGIYERSISKDTYYVLTFVGTAISPADARLRQSKRVLLETNVTPKMQDYLYKLAKPISASVPTVILLTCDFPMGAGDLNRLDLADLSRRNVLATLWGGSEGERASIVYVSLPHYAHRTGSRREVEVAWLRLAATSDELDDWGRELGRNSIAQQAMLALAVGFVAIKQADLQLAKLSLCQVRSYLKPMTLETVRPAPEDLERDMQRLIDEALVLVDEAAREKGVDLNSIAAIKLACST